MNSQAPLVRIAGPLDHPARPAAVRFERLAGRRLQTANGSLRLATELVILPSGEKPSGATTKDLSEARSIGKPVRYWTPPHLAVLLSGDTASWAFLCTTCLMPGHQPSTIDRCRVAKHPQLKSALQEDIYERHGRGVYLVLTDNFHDDDLVLFVDAILTPQDITTAKPYVHADTPGARRKRPKRRQITGAGNHEESSA